MANTVKDIKKSEDKSNLPNSIFKDDIKWLLIPSKVLLEIIFVWPDKQDKWTRFASSIFIAIYLFFLYAEVSFVLDKNTNLASAANAIITIVITVEAVGRRIIAMIYAKKISNILQVVYHDFWPSDIVGKEVLSERSFIFAGSAILYLICGSTYVLQNAVVALKQHTLEFSSKYPFDADRSPVYELLYICQLFLVAETDTVIITFDLFLISLIWICVAQFKLLKAFLIKNFEKAVKKAETDPEGGMKDAYALILLVYKRHNKLIEFCGEIEQMISIFTLVIYIGNVLTLCFSSFLLTVVKEEVFRPLIYFFGHLSQILLYCFVGNELIFESTSLSDTVYECGWHLIPYHRQLRKSLVLIMARSQRSLTMSIGGFGVLNLTSFMKLLQFCFSVYILLSKMMDKQAI